MEANWELDNLDGVGFGEFPGDCCTNTRGVSRGISPCIVGVVGEIGLVVREDTERRPVFRQLLGLLEKDEIIIFCKFVQCFVYVFLVICVA